MVELFFNKEFETEINNKMLYRNYIFQKEEVLNYVNNINSISLHEFVSYIDSHSQKYNITSKDVFQFSSFNFASKDLCEKVIKIDNPGLKFLDAGKLLLNDGVERKNGAYTKYGENHLKTAEDIGLMFSIEKTYFLTCIGFVFPELDYIDMHKILCRLLLRNKFIQFIIKISRNSKIDLREVLSFLSTSTYQRRRSNIKYILNLLVESQEYNFSFLIENIIF